MYRLLYIYTPLSVIKRSLATRTRETIVNAEHDSLKLTNTHIHRAHKSHDPPLSHH